MGEKNEALWMKTGARELSEIISPDPGRQIQAMAVIQQEIDKKQISYRPVWRKIIWIQLQYISPVFWVLQGGMLLAEILLLWRTSLTQGQLTDYLWWGSVAAAWLGMLACGDLGRHLSRGMAELEQSCYINLPQMWTIRMILAGAVDIVSLGLCCGGIAGNTDTPVWQVSVYLLVPFVMSNICCLLFLTASRSDRWSGGQLALAVLLAVAAVAPSLMEEAYTWNFLWVWMAALLAGMLFLAKGLRDCYRRLSRGEILCWN